MAAVEANSICIEFDDCGARDAAVAVLVAGGGEQIRFFFSPGGGDVWRGGRGQQ